MQAERNRRAGHRGRALALLAVIAMAMVSLTGTASAATATVSGTINPEVDPSAPVVFITDPVCAGLGSVQVHYHIIPLVPRVTGVHTITETGGENKASIYVIEGQANPANFSEGCIAASNQQPIDLPVNLTEGQRYDIVVFDDTFTQLGTSYVLGVDASVLPALGTADLGIGLTTTGGPHVPGATVPLAATITNGGPQPAVGVTTTITLPPGLDPASITDVVASAGYACSADPATGVLTCTADEHLVDAEATITFNAKVAETAAPGSYIVEGAVESDTVDTDDSNNTATVAVEVIAAPIVIQPRFTG